MKSQTTLIFLLFIILYGLPACREDRSIRPEILEVESIVDSLPEKALEMLKTEPLATGAASEAERMKMALLKNKAEDKLYVEHKNDSTMKAVVAYYKENGTPAEQMEAYYQLGGTYRDKHDGPKAIECYTQAMIIGEEHPEATSRKLLSRVYGQLAWLVSNQRNTKLTLEIARKKSRLYGDKDYYSLQELGSRFMEDNQYDSAVYYMRTACQAVDRLQPVDTAEMLLVYGSALVHGAKMKNDELVEDCYERLRHFRNDVLPDIALDGKHYYFRRVNTDSAIKYLEMAYRKDTVLERRMGEAVSLCHLHYKVGNLLMALRYSLERDSMYAIFADELQYQQAANAYNQYVYERDKQKELQMAQARFNAERKLNIALLLLVGCSIAGVVLFKRFRRARKSWADDTKRLHEDLLHHQKLHKRINREQLRVRLHQLARKSDGEAQAPVEMLQEVVETFALENPEFVAKLKATIPDLKDVDRLMLYLRALGLNQSETAKILGRSRSTVSHRMSALLAELPELEGEEDSTAQ